MVSASKRKKSAYAKPKAYIVPQNLDPNKKITASNALPSKAMVNSPRMLTPQVPPATNTSMLSQKSAMHTTTTIAMHQKPVTTDSFLFTSATRSTHLPSLTDIALHRAYKTVGMRPDDIRCFNCLSEKDHLHRMNWMHCGAICPACPLEKQHWGSFCPRLCMLRRKEAFWMERADIGFADGFDGPIPGIEGWKRLGHWKKGWGGEETAQSQSMPQYLGVSSVSPVTSTPSTPPRLKSSMAYSPTSIVSALRTPVLEEAETACTIEIKDGEESSSLRLSHNSAPKPLSTFVGVCETHHEVARSLSTSPKPTSTPAHTSLGDSQLLKQRGKKKTFTRPRSRSRSRSPSRKHGRRTYRERSSLRPFPVKMTPEKPAVLAKSRPTIASLFSDPAFKLTVMGEATIMASSTFSNFDPHQHAPIDSILLSVLRAAKAVQREGTKDWGYEPSEAMKMYLDYAYKHFPRLMSESDSTSTNFNSRQQSTDASVDTYYGKAWTGSSTQVQDARERLGLLELDGHFIEGWSEPSRRLRERGNYRKYNDDTHNLRLSGTSDRHEHWDSSRSKPVGRFGDDTPATTSTPPIPRGPRNHTTRMSRGYRKHSAPIPRGSHRHTGIARSLKITDDLIPRGPDRCPQGNKGASRLKPMTFRTVHPALIPPPFLKKGTEEGETVEIIETADKKSDKDIFKGLEMELGGVEIAEEDWEDLFKGDV